MKRELEAALASVCKAVFETDVTAELTRPDEQFGDYATNVALQLAGKLNKNPREIAESLANKLRESLAGKVAEVSVAGPGFLNLKLTDAALVAMMKQEPAKTLSGKNVVTEYSDPNPFKVLHAGHLYTTLVGDAISRLLETAGAEVHRVNFGGDVGLHVARCMWGIVRTLGGELPEKLKDVGEDPHRRAAWLSARYVEGNTAYEENDQTKAEIIEMNKRVYQLHAEDDHDSPFAQIYWTARAWSYDYFDVLYKELDVRPFERYYPESLTAPVGVETVKAQLERGVYEESDGAVIFNGDVHSLHTRVFINSQGLPTYETKDVGLLMLKWRDYHFDESIIITGNDIVEYMKVVLMSVAQFEPELVARTKHLTHGNLKLAGGMKMSSRKGNVLLALDVLEAARAVNRELMGHEDEQTMLGAVKYAFLKQRIGADIVYDPKESVALEGNSGPYLQYAHARARSILKKAEVENSQIESLEVDERSLVRKISEYSEVVEKAVSELMPHHICTYLYELAQVFNRFYEHNRVIGSERERERLALVSAYADVLKEGLGLLGIAAPDTM